jgi:hypothetical protein
MDRNLIVTHLVEAEDHVRLGEEHLAKQRVIVAHLQQKEADVQERNQAISLLNLLEELQTMHVAHRDRLNRLLDAFNEGFDIDESSPADARGGSTPVKCHATRRRA